MGSPAVTPMPPLPRKNLVQATLAAFLVAGLLLVSVVLPAEYGFDPLGTGRFFGVAAISNPPAAAPIRFAEDETGNAAPVREGPLTHYRTPFNVNRAVLVIPSYQYVEYKYHMLKDASLEFTWEASGPVAQDNHSEPDTYPGDPAVSFDKRKVDKANGTLVAPFNGLHGWYWENLGGTPVTVTVTATGYYDYAVELRTNHFRRRHDIYPAVEMAKAVNPAPSKGDAP